MTTNAWREICLGNNLKIREFIMEALQSTLQDKTVQHLKKLNEKISSDVHGQVELAEKLKEVNVLREKVQELSRRKKELEERLKCMPKDLVVAKILKDVTVDDVMAISLPSQAQKELVVKAAKLEQKRQLEYVLMAHRCAGITGQLIEREKRVRVRFETTYKGEFFEPFYLELEFVDKTVKPCWHTIPVFVPLGSFVERYNKNEIHFSTLLYAIHTYLKAFIHRRQQTVEFSNQYSEYLGSEEIASNYAYCTTQLILSIPISEDSTTELVVQLYYKDLQSNLPDKVRCSKPDKLPVDRLRIKQAFRTLPIAEAFQNLFLDQNIEQG